MKKTVYLKRMLASLILVLVMSVTLSIPAHAAKPSTKNVKAKITSVIYKNATLKTYYKIKFTNNSSKKIKSVKVKLSGVCDEKVTTTKTVKLNLKSKKSKTVKVYFYDTIDKPESCKVKIKSINY